MRRRCSSRGRGTSCLDRPGDIDRGIVSKRPVSVRFAKTDWVKDLRI